ncbi:Hypothetical predicted protein [Pelobates cultripes]|uniref:Uncharacterized protein n=1 Tax=Pelobates cultripes TaxID=61616 RepID=A0AAD1S828_PELCU|nr:Hypothetical predicted protein [Pelobates cultripes]
MHTLLYIAVFLCPIIYTNGVCIQFNCSPLINITNTPYLNCELNWTEISKCINISTLIIRHSNIKDIGKQFHLFKNLEHLEMSHNKLNLLSDYFLHDATALVNLSLNENRLTFLPRNFLNNSKKIKFVNLEGNLLSSIPETIFHQNLSNLTVDCTCKVAQSISHACNNNTNCNHTFIQCKLGSTLFDLKEFLQECGSAKLMAIYIAVPIALLLLILGTVAYFMYTKIMTSTNLEDKGSPDKSPTHMQPRYTTTNNDSIQQTTTEFSCERREYENVMVAGPTKNNKIKPYEWHGPEPQGGKRNMEVEEGIYLESDVADGDQPIYSNTQPTYYSYTEPGTMNNEHTEEDVYILPDQ